MGNLTISLQTWAHENPRIRAYVPGLSPSHRPVMAPPIPFAPAYTPVYPSSSAAAYSWGFGLPPGLLHSASGSQAPRAPLTHSTNTPGANQMDLLAMFEAGIERVKQWKVDG